MSQRSRFWISLVAITLVCYVDYQFFNEGYQSRRVPATIRQVAHLVVLLAVMPIGYWALKRHVFQWLNKIWLLAYGAALSFILCIGALKVFTGALPDFFLDWATTVRYFFCSPLPFLLINILPVIAKQKD